MSNMNEEEFDEDHAMDMVLNNMINQLQTVRMRFANESEYVTISNFESKNFMIEKEFNDEVYGRYKGEYVMINKEDYNTTIL